MVHIAREIVGLLRYMGYGLCVAWGFLLFSISEFQPNVDSYFVYATAPGAVLCVVLLVGKIRPAGFRTGFAFLCGALAALGTLLQTMAQFDGTLIELIGMFAGGFAFAGLLSVWFAAYVSLQIRSVFFCSGVSLAIGALVCIGVSSLPFDLAGLATSVLPLAAVLFLPDCKEEDTGHHFLGLAKDGMVFRGDIPIKVLVGLFLVYAVLDTVRSVTRLPGSFFGRADVGYLVVPLLVAIVCVAVAVPKRKKFDLSTLPKAVFAALTVSMVLSLTLSIPHYNFGFSSSMCTQVLCWLFLVCVAKSGALSASSAFYFGWLAEFAGGVVAQAMAPVLYGRVIVTSFALALAMSAAVVFLFSGKGLIVSLVNDEKGARSRQMSKRIGDAGRPYDGVIGRETANEGAGGAAGNTTAHPDYTERFCAERMLTAREKDVFKLWITGHSMRHIQEELYVSQGTVKTHLRNIYDKCGVHTRDELMRMFESEKAQND